MTGQICTTGDVSTGTLWVTHEEGWIRAKRTKLSSDPELVWRTVAKKSPYHHHHQGPGGTKGNATNGAMTRGHDGWREAGAARTMFRVRDRKGRRSQQIGEGDGTGATCSGLHFNGGLVRTVTTVIPLKASTLHVHASRDCGGKLRHSVRVAVIAKGLSDQPPSK